jgi:uncharacterized small protein (DUF1192 family)
MLEEDLDSAKRPARPKPLDPLSIDELDAYIAALKVEIMRAEAAIAAKQAHRDRVSALFKTPG